MTGCGDKNADKAIGIYKECAKCADDGCAKAAAKKMASFQKSLDLEAATKMVEHKDDIDKAEKNCDTKYPKFTEWVGAEIMK